MSSKIKLKLLGLTHSQVQSNAYALILAEVNGPKRIPIIVGATEAQSIAIELEGIIPPRPLTHDLFASFAHAFGVKLVEVYIYKFEDGIFSSELTFDDGKRQVTIDSRTSDAIAIALRTKAPIYTTREILEETGFEMGDYVGKPQDDEPEEERVRTPKLENYALSELESMLAQHIENEQYEEAAKIQAIINAKKSASDNG